MGRTRSLRHPGGHAASAGAGAQPFQPLVSLYDAWAAYDTNGAVGYLCHGKHTSSDVVAARNEAISYAAYRMLKERHVYSRTACTRSESPTRRATTPEPSALWSNTS